MRFAAIAVGIALVASDAHAGQATCSNPGLPVGAGASRDLFPGRLTLSLTNSLLTVSSSEVLAEGQGQVRYDAGLVLVETRLSAELALRSWLGVGLSVPYRVIDVDVAYRDPATGAPVTSQQAGIHARDERLHVEAQRGFGPITGAAWGIALLSLYDNEHGYRAGDRYSAGLNGAASLGTKAWTFGLSTALHAETAETWSGIVHADEGNAGRVDVLAGGSIAWRPIRGLAVLASIELPVYSHVNGPQVDYGIATA